METRNLPIGIQDFEYLRKNSYIYIDKTDFVYKLAHKGKPYFLSRPRRFGKSLLLSTLEAYFLGKKDLFKGLEIEKLKSRIKSRGRFILCLNFLLRQGILQSYLTIKTWNERQLSYKPGFPNDEVKYGFLNALACKRNSDVD